MDVTYAVVNKARRGGGAGGQDPAPFSQNAAPFGRDPASFSRNSAPFGRDPAPLPASPLPAADDGYEVVTPPGDAGSAPRLGFNFRIGKPKGPREPPADWSRG